MKKLTLLTSVILLICATFSGCKDEKPENINIKEIVTVCDCVDRLLEVNQSAMKIIGEKTKRDELDENEKNHLRLLTDKLVEISILSKKYTNSEVKKCPNFQNYYQEATSNLSLILDMDGKSMEWFQKL